MVVETVSDPKPVKSDGSCGGGGGGSAKLVLPYGPKDRKNIDNLFGNAENTRSLTKFFFKKKTSPPPPPILTSKLKVQLLFGPKTSQVPMRREGKILLLNWGVGGGGKIGKLMKQKPQIQLCWLTTHEG